MARKPTHFSMRSLYTRVTRATMHRAGGVLGLLSGRVDGQVFVSVLAYDPARPRSNRQLQEAIFSTLADFSLTATMQWDSQHLRDRRDSKGTHVLKTLGRVVVRAPWLVIAAWVALVVVLAIAFPASDQDRREPEAAAAAATGDGGHPTDGGGLRRLRPEHLRRRHEQRPRSAARRRRHLPRRWPTSCAATAGMSRR